MSTRAPTLNVLFGELRSLLAAAPGKVNWVRLCLLFDDAYALDPERVAQSWIPYAAPTISTWPAALRVCPSRWFVSLELGTIKPMLAMTTTLAWTDAQLSESTITRMAAASALSNLRTLDLSSNPLSGQALAALVGRHAAWASSLDSLILRACDLGAAMSQEPFLQACLPSLSFLDLSYNDTLQYQDLRYLLNHPGLPSLERLLAIGCGLDPHDSQAPDDVRLALSLR